MSNTPSRFRWNLAILSALGFALFDLNPIHCIAAAASSGTVIITIRYPDGTSAANPKIYFVGEESGMRVQEVSASGSLARVDLPPGRYRIFAGVQRTTLDAVDHLVTPEAKVQLHEYEQVSIILTLEPPTPAPMDISESTLRHMGLDPSLAPSIN